MAKVSRSVIDFVNDKKATFRSHTLEDVIGWAIEAHEAESLDEYERGLSDGKEIGWHEAHADWKKQDEAVKAHEASDG